MAGVMIESAPLTADQAKLVLTALQSASIPALAVEQFLAAVISLRRIADGTDAVSEKS